MNPMIRPYFHDPSIFYVELIYTAIILFLSFMIYFKTKEIYDLTNHKGIWFFRNTFLFFGLAYFFRFLISAFDVTRISLDLHISQFIIKPLVLVLVSYLSTMAIFSLIFSTVWKTINMRKFIFAANLFAIISSIFVFVTRSPYVLILSQIILLVIAIILSYAKHSKSKKFSHLFAIYILLFVFWIFNIIFVGPPRFLPLEIRIIHDLISIGIFLLIFYKVKKWTR